MKKVSLDSIVARTHAITTLPTAYLQLNQVVNNPRSSFADVARVIRKDVGLSSRLLKLVNSAFFGFPSKIDSISRACVIVGTLQLRSLALATSVIDAVALRDETLFSITSFWQHSICCAVASSALARWLGNTDVERFFVAGVLHDVGRIVLMNEAPEGSVAAVQEANSTGRLLHEVELDMFGFSHAEVGGALLRRWNLPATLVEPVMSHHRAGGSIAYAQESACLQVGDMIAHALGLFGGSAEVVVPASAGCMDVFSGYAEKVDVLLAQTARQYKEIAFLMLDDAA